MKHIAYNVNNSLSCLVACIKCKLRKYKATNTNRMSNNLTGSH